MDDRSSSDLVIRLLPILVIAAMLLGVVASVLVLRPGPSPEQAKPPIPQFRAEPVSSQSFDHDRDTLTPQGISDVADIARRLKTQGATEVIVVGYADRDGTADYNDDLSRRRAATVMKALSDAVDKNRLRAVGVGSSFARADSRCDTLARDERIRCYERDRRVEIWSRPSAEDKASPPDDPPGGNVSSS